ncbi:hypothetical protein [Sphingobacterium sp. LRF_L2]|uniref:hypothetical protein n=1 Tax=Sphingobacterium sp. LRF_L2 TaxID=3369421 RepID=UPI003F5F2D6E
MATKFKALIGFSRWKDDELVVYANTIVNAMTDNANFPAPSPALAEVQTVVHDFAMLSKDHFLDGRQQRRIKRGNVLM